MRVARHIIEIKKCTWNDKEFDVKGYKLFVKKNWSGCSSIKVWNLYYNAVQRSWRVSNPCVNEAFVWTGYQKSLQDGRRERRQRLLIRSQGIGFIIGTVGFPKNLIWPRTLKRYQMIKLFWCIFEQELSDIRQLGLKRPRPKLQEHRTILWVF